jgi:hypothetical protein
MKAEPLEIQSVEASSLADMGQAACIVQENDFECPVTMPSGLARVRVITDKELALAAYAQAVALRDRCVERAMASRVGARQ